MTWRDDILGLPEPEQLPAALNMIRDLMGGGTAEICHWQGVLGVPPAAALVFGVLLSRPGVIVSRETIYSALEFSGRKGYGKSLDVNICYLRRALRQCGRNASIRAVFGAGYILDQHCAADILERYPPRYAAPRQTLADAAEFPLERRGTPWDNQDDLDLRRMVLRGDELRFIAYELQRTERAVILRCDLLGLRRRLRIGPTPYPSRRRWDARDQPAVRAVG